MPQMNKGGKFIFGKSLIRDDLTIHLPTQALTEYNSTTEGKIYLFTGSKATGGFCVARKGLLEPSKLGYILTDNPIRSSDIAFTMGATGPLLERVNNYEGEIPLF